MGEGALGARAPPAFHTLAMDMSVNRGATHLETWTKAMYYLIVPITNIPTPPSQNYPVSPLGKAQDRGKLGIQNIPFHYL